MLHRLKSVFALVLCLNLQVCCSFAYEVVSSTTNADGIITESVRSEYQYEVNPVRVLLPDKVEAGKHYVVLYILPVEEGVGGHYGDGLLEVKKLGLQNRFNLICVSPTFDHLPWYADHATDPKIRQESYLLKVVLPLVDSKYPVIREARGRLLMGFSKSGWGAFTLLLRHPDLFGKASAWDSPMMKDKPNQYGMGPIFGTQENFEQYQVTKLLTARATELKKQTRLIITGYENFKVESRQAHEFMESLGVSHVYRDGPFRKHIWGSGWVQESVELLMLEDNAAK